jgi:acyl-CoA synthetase (AMP-forming)/AMP-acid ligase II
MSLVAVETPATDVVSALAGHALSRPGALAFRFLGRHRTDTRDLTWKDLDEAARRIAAHPSMPALRGAPVAVICPNPPDFVQALAGCLYAGAVLVPVPAVASRRSAERIRAAIAASSPRAIVAPRTVLSQPWIAELRGPQETARLELEELLDQRPSAANGIGTVSGPAIMQFTSGSTGTPRGVVITHANIAANCAAICAAYELGAEARAFSWLPLHHDMGLIGHVVTPLWRGFTSIMMDPLLFLQRPLRWLQQLTEERATVTSAPNFAYEQCVRAARETVPTGVDLSHLQTAICGGEPVWPRTMEGFCEAFEPFGFRRSAFAPSYGLAEATLLVSSGKGPDGPRVYAGKVGERDGTRGVRPVDVVATNLGKPVSGVQTRIMDPVRLHECPEGVIGEIEISGTSVGETQPSGEPRQPGPVRTGDLGFLIGGELHITGRSKELIILRGQNIYPSDIESAALQADPDLIAGGLAAIGVERDGTQALVLVFEVDKRTFSPARRRELCRSISGCVTRLTGFTPADLVPVPIGSLPRTTNGKIRRGALAENYRRGELVSLLPSSELAIEEAEQT